jgi:hypothetical protein
MNLIKVLFYRMLFWNHSFLENIVIAFMLLAMIGLAYI